MMKRKGGFTLIELLVVMIILGILAAIAVPTYIGATNRARAAEAIHQIDALKTEIQGYYQTHSNTWPADLSIVSPGYTAANWNPGGTARFNYSSSISNINAWSNYNTGTIWLNAANQIWGGTHPGAPQGSVS